MNQDHGNGPAALLDIHEIAQRVLEQMHPIEKGEVDLSAFKLGLDIVLLNELITCGIE